MNEVTVSISIKTLHCNVNLNFVAQYSAWTNAGLLSISLCAMFSFWNTESWWRWLYRSCCHLLYIPFLQPYSNLPSDSSALKLRILWWSLHGETFKFQSGAMSKFPFGLPKRDMTEPLLQGHGVQLHYFVCVCFLSIYFF